MNKPYQVDVLGEGAVEAVRDYVKKFRLAVTMARFAGGVSVYGPAAWAVGAAFENVGWTVEDGDDGNGYDPAVDSSDAWRSQSSQVGFSVFS
jgi:hypothetical protein